MMLSGSLSNSYTEEFDISNSRKLLKSVPNVPPLELTDNDISSELSLIFRKSSQSRKSSLNRQRSNIEDTSFKKDGANSSGIGSDKSLPNIRLSKSSEASLTNYDTAKNLKPNDRILLFQFPSAKIMSFDEQLTDESSSSSTTQGFTCKTSGRLLGHGAFEIFQMHDGNVTYLSCGSVIYPLLPKLRILRISLNQFIIPLVNPERYWQVIIDSSNLNIINDLENSLHKVCLYRNLFFTVKKEETKERKSENHNSANLYAQNKETNEETRNGKENFSDLNAIPRELNQESLKCDSIRTSSSTEEVPRLSHTIIRNSSLDSITSAVASFNFDFTNFDDPQQANFHDFKFPAISPTDTTVLPKSRSPRKNILDQNLNSSLDSLIDEYEENISNTIRTTQLHSRTKTPSVSQYSNTVRNYVQVDENDTLTRTSSRQPSLYLPESTWMEPDDTTEKKENFHAYPAYQQIYHVPSTSRSTTTNYLLEERLSSISSSRQSIPLRNITYSHSMNGHHRSESSSTPRSKSYPKNINGNNIRGSNNSNFKLNSNDVYSLVSKSTSKLNSFSKEREKQNSLVYRLFGW